MPSPAETVDTFLSMWSRPGGFAEAVQLYFTPDTRYINVGMSDTRGIDETLAFIEGFEQVSGPGSHIRVETLTSASEGNRVLNERIDEVVAADGRVVASIGVMGIFVVEDGKITEWRDYFDTAGLAAQRGDK